MNDSLESLLLSENDSFFRRLLKKLYLRLFGWLFAPMASRLRSTQAELDRRLSGTAADLDRRLSDTTAELDRRLSDTTAELDRRISECAAAQKLAAGQAEDEAGNRRSIEILIQELKNETAAREESQRALEIRHKELEEAAGQLRLENEILRQSAEAARSRSFEVLAQELKNEAQARESSQHELEARHRELAERAESLLSESASLQQDAAAAQDESRDLLQQMSASAQDENRLLLTKMTQDMLEEVRNHREDLERRMGAVARDLVRTKWSLRDYLSSLKDEGSEEMTCMICGCRAPIRTLKTVEADCIFAGGRLVRYECPDCGCIFGPRKVLIQSGEEFSDDYTVHYAGFQEGDSTWKEREAFELLEPVTSGMYLDYGCGKWSHTIDELRAEGYNVFGYEPYADDVDNPYIITDKSRLAGMRFDGIFSNDVLEHLTDPVGDMQFMKLLLRTPSSRIAHCTSCYAYKYEYTRFHLNFFTGRSVQVLAEKAGLTIRSCVNQLEERDFYCYVFGIEDRSMDLMPRMYGVPVEEGGLRSVYHRPIYGPYLTLPADRYCFLADIAIGGERQSAGYRITSEKGKKLVSEGELVCGENRIKFTVSRFTEDVEFVVFAPEDAEYVQLNSFSMVW